MATVIPGSIQSNRDRAELVALRRLGTVEDCAKVVEFLATDWSDYVTPVDGGLVRGWHSADIRFRRDGTREKLETAYHGLLRGFRSCPVI
jgi:hypothetical protein